MIKLICRWYWPKVAHILKGGDGPLKKGSLSASMVQSTSTAKLVIPKTKLTILSRADYPVVTNFPDSLVSLKVSLFYLEGEELIEPF